MTTICTQPGELMLLPCPFSCGGTVSIVRVGAWNKCRAVYCESCEIYGPMMATDETAAFAWNHRTPAAKPEAPLDSDIAARDARIAKLEQALCGAANVFELSGLNEAGRVCREAIVEARLPPPPVAIWQESAE